MNKIFTFSLFAVFSVNTFGQVITQNENPNSVLEFNSVACGSGGSTSDNYYSRVFKLSDYGINYDYKISKIDFGVQNVSDDLSVTLNVYRVSSGTYPDGSTELLKSVEVPLSSSDNLSVVSSGNSLSQVIPDGSSFVVEIFNDGLENETAFYMGSNDGNQTGPSFLKSKGCGLSTPMATGTGDLSDFSNTRWVMSVTGESNLGVTEIINSRDLKIFPNPVKDVLNFKLSDGLKVESIEIFDLSGKKVNAVSSKLISSVNVSNLSKGAYVLKVKSNDGKIHIQKLIKE